MGTNEIVPEKPVKEQIREQKRSVDRSKRNLQREQRKLENQKKKMLQEVKKMAAKGQTTGAKMLAKDIVRATNQCKKLEQFIGQLTAVSLRISSCASLNELSEAMNAAAIAMTKVSNKLDTQKLNSLAKEMSKESMKIDMKQDMIQDVLDGVGESMGDEEQEEELYNQVLQEAGVKISEEMVGAGKEKLETKKVNAGSQKQLAGVGVVGGEVDDLDAMLKSLDQ